MKKILIKPCSIKEMSSSPKIHFLLAEYGKECSIAGIGEPQAQIETYFQMEKSGMIHPIGAFIDEELIGFMILILSTLPHYGKKVAVTESFFVSPLARKSGVGLKLIRFAENYAKKRDAVGILVSAPFGGRLAEVLPRIGFCETNRVFFRSL